MICCVQIFQDCDLTGGDTDSGMYKRGDTCGGTEVKAYGRWHVQEGVRAVAQTGGGTGGSTYGRGYGWGHQTSRMIHLARYLGL